VPLLTRESTVARKLFEDFGIIKGYDKSGLPIYDEYFCVPIRTKDYLCAALAGWTGAGDGISDEVEAEYKRFLR